MLTEPLQFIKIELSAEDAVFIHNQLLHMSRLVAHETRAELHRVSMIMENQIGDQVVGLDKTE